MDGTDFSQIEAADAKIVSRAMELRPGAQRGLEQIAFGSRRQLKYIT
jgi:hypothetical protein